MVRGEMRVRKSPPPRGRDVRAATQRPPASGGGGAGGLWIYGRHAACAAAANPKRRCRRLLALADAAAALTDAAAAAGVARPTVEVVDRHTLQALGGADAVHQGMVVQAEPLPPTALDDVLAPGGDAPLLVLDQVTDPRNVGAALRASAAFGASAVIVQDRHAPHETGVLAKAASGALETVPLVRVVNVARALRDARDAGRFVAGLDGNAPLALPDADLSGRMVLVLGSEGAGLRRLVRETCDVLVRIPIDAHVDSLNVATAAAVALYAVTVAR